MIKCPHGCYSPERNGFSDSCSLCKAMSPLSPEAAEWFKHTPEPVFCPECGFPVKINNQDQFKCHHCGHEE